VYPEVDMSRVITTPRLHIRPWETSDAEAALAIYTAPSVRPWLGHWADAPATSDETSARLREWSRETSTTTTCLGHWAVHDRTTSQVVGTLVLEHAPDSDSLTIGCALAPDARGRGYATEAGDALVRWAIHEGGAAEVFAIVQSDNTPAQATAERIGMEWVTDLGYVDDSGRYRVYRVRHGDLDWEDEV
jgi:[ribosomal protein S5]-alanine N-acetyltransferase